MPVRLLLPLLLLLGCADDPKVDGVDTDPVETDVADTDPVETDVADTDPVETDETDPPVDTDPPVCSAGIDRIADPGDTVPLNADPGCGDAFAWSLITRPPGSTASITNPTSASASLYVDVPGTYSVQLVVQAGALSSRPDLVNITVRAP